jgi:eukaryotic-like serine/threonine-protein kinase
LAYGLGTVIASRYRLVRILGRGGMAIVYEAEDLERGGSVALKMLEDEVRRDPEIVARFAREGRATRDLPTEFLGKVHAEGCADNGAPFLVMNVLRGKDLGALLRKHDVPWDQAVAIIVQACAGVAAAHDAGIIHRDLKPANIFVEDTSDGIHVRVLDFGVSKDLGAHLELTNPSDVIGTTGFMSPEQLKSSRRVDARTDVWALAVILYRMIAGAMPLRGSTPQILARTVDEEPLPRITRLDVPRALAKVIARALDKNPNGRPPDARAFAHALAPFAAWSPIVSAALAEIDRSSPSIIVNEPDELTRPDHVSAPPPPPASNILARVGFARGPALDETVLWEQRIFATLLVLLAFSVQMIVAGIVMR